MAHPVETKVVQVLVHPGAAAVTRRGVASITAPAEWAVVGLPLGLDDDSVQFTIDGAAQVVGVRVVMAAVERDDPEALEHALRAARLAVAEVKAEQAATAASLAALSALTPRAPRVEREALPPWDGAVAARLELIDVAHARGLALRADAAELTVRRDAAERALAATEERWRRRSSAERLAGELTKTVLAQVVPVGAGGDVTVTCRYRVAGARWAPTYVARIDDDRVRLELRAVVAQSTGEAWDDVAIEVSTAEPGRKVALPELPALRIGRAQPAPSKAGWRAPPVGAAELYGDWDRAFARLVEPPAPEPPPPPPPPPPSEDVEFDDDGASAELDGAMPSFAAAAPAPATVPMRTRAFMVGAPQGATRSASAPPQAKKSAAPAGGGGRGRPAPAAPAAPAVVAELEVGDDLLDYGALFIPPATASGRGQLRRTQPSARWQVTVEVAGAVAGVVGDRARRVQQISIPRGVTEPGPGQYDYAFPAAGRVDVPSDGAWHAIALSAHDAPVVLRHVVVPAVAPEVYRVATFTNPLEAPLLAGPVDVYQHGELILTAPLEETPPAGAVTIGLGVDADVKVARNVRYREEVAGVLRGSLRLVHDVAIDIEHRGRGRLALEVAERVPIPAADTDEVEVTIDQVTPMWERWLPEPAPGVAPLRSGYRWRLEVEPGAHRTLHVSYAVKIAAKHELVGGNRRDP